jgi:hypothetical protein
VPARQPPLSGCIAVSQTAATNSLLSGSTVIDAGSNASGTRVVVVLPAN